MTAMTCSASRAREALVYKVSGCTFTNTGFDGASYQPLWPDGNTAMHPDALPVQQPGDRAHLFEPVRPGRVRGRLAGRSNPAVTLRPVWAAR